MPALSHDWKLRVEAVLDLLNRYAVRATYGAVAAHTGAGNVRTFMTAFPKEARYSWVVSAQPPHEPTGYPESAWHPDLKKNAMVLSDARELAAWVRRKEGAALS